MTFRRHAWSSLAVLLLLLVGKRVWAERPLAAALAELDGRVVAPESEAARQLADMLPGDVRGRLHAALRRQARDFDALTSRQAWESFRDTRLKALKDSFGPAPPRFRNEQVLVTRTIAADGYQIENLVFESRPGLAVTANLYSPRPAGRSMPGILILHGFHQPKSQAELQDMGINWAKLGCLVLVPDILGHGERRQHPFRDAGSYPESFNPVRQDYYFRFNSGTQLYLAGENLMGWMAHDAIRCVDVLLSRPGVDRQRIIVLGAVAAGGDIAAVAAALDPRIQAAVPFNFGGPEPETPYPMPADPELRFPYASGHWDSTRRLRLGARDGFLPWVIVGSVAPRRLIYAHEFAWDRGHDPVWPRLHKIYGWYHAADHLAFAHGSGTLFGKPEGTGCANIGAVHRRELYPTLQRWFGLPIPEKEVQERRPADELLCLTAEAAHAFKPRSLTDLAAELADARLQAARQARPDASAQRRRQLQQQWATLLGNVEPSAEAKAAVLARQRRGDVVVERIMLQVEAEIRVPLLLLVPGAAEKKRPLVVAAAQHGKQEFLKQRADVIAQLLSSGVAVALPDLRGTGETCPPADRRGPPAHFFKSVEASSLGTLLACEELTLGRTLLGGRIMDLRSVLRYLRGRPDLDPDRFALWGDSFAAVNPPSRNVQVPWGVERLPAQSEPMGGLAVLLAALFEDGIRAVAVRGGLVSYRSVLDSPFCYLPADVVVPGVLSVGDLGDVAAVLAPRPLWFEALVDGRNRHASADSLAASYQPARQAYQLASAADRLRLVSGTSSDSLGQWLAAQLQARR